MNNKQKWFIVPLVIVLVLVVIVIGGGAYYFSKKSSPTPETAHMQTQTVPVQDKTTTPAPVVNTTVTENKTPASAPVVPKTTIYSDAVAGYSFVLPENWIVTKNSNISDPGVTSIYLSVKGKTADEGGFTFDIQTSLMKNHVDYYVQQYNKTPTNDDLFNNFIESQKSYQDQFVPQTTKKVLINGHEAYSVTALFGGGGGTEAIYVFYTSPHVYFLRIMALTDTWKSHEAEVLGVVGTFKIQ